MNEPAKRLARLALLAALGVVLLLLTHLVPAGRLGLMLLASFPVCAGVMMYGCGWAAAVFGVTALMGFLLFPGTTALGYALFFGWYPIVKSLVERVHSRWLTVLLKAGIYVLAFLLYWTLAREIFSGAETVLPLYAVFLAGAVAFVIYDWCYLIAIRFYLDKIARYIP